MNSSFLRRLGGGLIATQAPSLVKGALLEFMQGKKVDVTIATEWVEQNVIVWDLMNKKHKLALAKLRKFGADLDWLTGDWLIETFREEMPAVASLFLGWKKANNWLNRQVEIIKKKVME